MRYASLSVLALCVTLPAALALSPNAQADPGIYIGAGAGLYTLDIDNVDFDDGDLIARVIAGYRISDHLAVEADYQSLAESEDNFAKIEVDAWTVSFRAILPISDLIEIYGKLGYASYNVDVSISGLGSADDSESDLLWGGGIDFNLKRWTLRGEVVRIEVDDADLNLITATALFNF